jgi:hypothetical protein
MFHNSRTLQIVVQLREVKSFSPIESENLLAVFRSSQEDGIGENA